MTLPTFEETLKLLDIDYQDDLDIADVSDNYIGVDVLLDEYDLEKGYSIENFVIQSKDDAKYYMIKLMFEGGEGYTKIISPWQECFPKTIKETRYVLK